MVPRAETISYDVLPMRDSAPAPLPPDTTGRGATVIFLQRRLSSLLDTFPNISTGLRNTIDLYRSLRGRAERLVQPIFRRTAGIHNAASSRSQFIPLLAALYAGKSTAVINLQMSTLFLLLSEAKSKGVSGR